MVGISVLKVKRVNSAPLAAAKITTLINSNILFFLLLKQTADQFGATIGAEVTLHLYIQIKYSSTQSFKRNQIKSPQHYALLHTSGN